MKILISISIVFTSLIFADSLSHGKCMDKAQTTNAEVQDCNEKELKYQDKILNKYYKMAMKNLYGDNQEKQNLKLAQRAWIKFRDLDCKSQSYPMRGGTAEYTMYQNCMIELTSDRINTLKKY